VDKTLDRVSQHAPTLTCIMTPSFIKVTCRFACFAVNRTADHLSHHVLQLTICRFACFALNRTADHLSHRAPPLTISRIVCRIACFAVNRAADHLSHRVSHRADRLINRASHIILYIQAIPPAFITPFCLLCPYLPIWEVLLCNLPTVGTYSNDSFHFIFQWYLRKILYPLYFFTSEYAPSIPSLFHPDCRDLF
jgi:hypothetical protein